jgi:hypothetical protein
MPFLSYTIEVEGLSYEPLFEQVYSTSMAMLLTMVLSVYLFNVRATLQVPLFFFFWLLEPFHPFQFIQFFLHVGYETM